ncbi:hypothetical protein SpCBS45565_g06651 [Spizellomyces sp. 'palustris']|nr:hypothetical protein SpCBS45565_g06651 [Spizellomyces sp. 'palustris']
MAANKGPSQGFLSKLLPARRPRGLVATEKSRVSHTLDGSRDSFAKVLGDAQLYTEFRQKFSSSTEGAPLLLFRDGYIRLESLLLAIAAGADIRHALPDPGVPPCIRRFLRAETHSSGSSNSNDEVITVPDWLTTLLNRFYRSFVITGGPEEIVGLSQAVQQSVADKLTLLDENRVPVSVLDDAADEVHELLYKRFYPEFLASKRGKSPVSDLEEAVGRLSLDAGLTRKAGGRKRVSSLSSEDSDSSAASKGRRKWLGLGKGVGNPVGNPSKSRASSVDGEEPELELQYTRDCFIRVLYHQELYAELVEFAKETLCLENIMFYEAYIRLELQISEALPEFAGVPKPEIGLTRCLLRFLEQNTSTVANPTTTTHMIPASIMDHVLLFYSAFIMPGAQHEVNISHAIRRGIITRLQQRNEAGVPALVAPAGISVTVFDPAVDEILDLLYRNTFHLFLKHHERKNALTGSKRSDSGKGDISQFIY